MPAAVFIAQATDTPQMFRYVVSSPLNHGRG
jgi:hypothetical protein